MPTGLVKLPAECLIGSLDGLRAQLLERVAIETPVSFDAAAVERIDTAALQLLAAFTRDRRAAGLQVEWRAVTGALSDAASLLNLTSVLALDAAAGETLKVAA
jgi:phospholipid transport system transporter-binding protein